MLHVYVFKIVIQLEDFRVGDNECPDGLREWMLSQKQRPFLTRQIFIQCTPTVNQVKV